MRKKIEEKNVHKKTILANAPTLDVQFYVFANIMIKKKLPL